MSRTLGNSKFFFQVSLVNDDDRSFAALLDRAAIILENIEELSLLKFDIGLKGVGDNDNEEAVMNNDRLALPIQKCLSPLVFKHLLAKRNS